MERLRYLATGTVVAVALAAGAQQSAVPNASSAPASGEQQQSSTQADVSSVEQQMKVFTKKLNLSAEQQAKLRPIVQRLYDATMKVVQDPSLSHEERMERVRPEHLKAHEEMQQILTDEQKEKLQAYMQGPHPELHWNLGGVRSTQAQ